MKLTEKKTLTAILYFVKETRHCYKTKLFKLLFFWDFLNIKNRGESITGYTYVAFPHGPVPLELYRQIESGTLPSEFRNTFTVKEYADEDDRKSFRIVVKQGMKPDLDWLSKSEKDLLEQLSFTFVHSTAKEMTEITHLKNTPWHKTIEQLGLHAVIDYLLALDEDSFISREDAEERIRLQKELQQYGRI